MSRTLYWHDYETTGTDPGRDRIVQFAGVRTDLELNVQYESPVRYCALADDVLPEPAAMLITGIRLAVLAEQGEREIDFIRSVLKEFSVPGTCVAGYNNLRFDDEFTRNTLYRNLLDPYAREWQAGNSRWDIIDLARMTHALRPQGINWPKNDNGHVSFRLEDLAAANAISHDNAHDALADVRATIGLAQLIRRHQPRLYQFLFDLRDKRKVLQQLYPLGKSPLLHVSSMYPAARNCLAMVLPLAAHPTNSNGIIVYDLSVDPQGFIDCSVEELKERIFSPKQEMHGERIPLKTIHINRCPAIAPLSTLTPQRAQASGIDLARSTAYVEQLQRAGGVVEKIQDAFGAAAYIDSNDPDLMLYSGGFFEDSDRRLMEQVHTLAPDHLGTRAFDFGDPRLSEMLFRLRARNYPDTLSDEERVRWHSFCATRLAQRKADYLGRIEALTQASVDLQAIDLLEELKRRCLELESIHG